MWSATEHAVAAASEGASAEDVLRRFVERTPVLTAAEQAELVVSVAEAGIASGSAPARAAPSRPSPSGRRSSGPRPSTTAPNSTSGPRPTTTPTPGPRPGTAATSLTAGPRPATSAPGGGLPDLRQLGDLGRQMLGVGLQVAPVIQQLASGAPQPLAPAATSGPAAAAQAPTSAAVDAPEPQPDATTQPDAAAAPTPVASAQPATGSLATPPSTSSPPQLAALLGALHQGQIPSLTPAASPVQGAAQPTLDATALLSLILSNPELQRGLRRAAVLGPRHGVVQLPLPAPHAAKRPSVVPIPMSAILPLLAALVSRSSAELAEQATSESEADQDHEYLLTESGDFIVEPSDAARRTDLVAHYFRCSAEALRSGSFDGSEAL